MAIIDADRDRLIGLERSMRLLASFSLLVVFASWLILTMLPSARVPAAAGTTDSIQQDPSAYRHERSWYLPPLGFEVSDLALTEDGYAFMSDDRASRTYVHGPDGALLRTLRPPQDAGDSPSVRLAAAIDADQVFVFWSSQKTGSTSEHDHWMELRASNGEPIEAARKIESSQPIRRLDAVDLTRPGKMALVSYGTVYALDIATATVEGAADAGDAFSSAPRLAGFSDGGYAVGPARRAVGPIPLGAIRFFEESGQIGYRLTITDAIPLDIVRAPGDHLMVYEMVEPPPGEPRGMMRDLRIRVYDRSAQLVSTLEGGDLDRLRIDQRGGHGYLDRSASGLLSSHQSVNHGFSVHAPDGALRWQRDAWRGPEVQDGRLLPGQSKTANLALDVHPAGGVLVLDGRGLSAELFRLEPSRTATGLPIAARLDTAALLALRPSGEAYLLPADGVLCRLEGSSCLPTSIHCDCPEGGRLAIGGPVGRDVYLGRPRQGELRVADLGLDAVTGRLRLPDGVGAWPADVADLPAGEVLTADPVSGQLQRWSPSGKLSVLYGNPIVEKMPRRVDARRLSGGRQVAAILLQDGTVGLMDADSGGWIADFRPADLVPSIGRLDDIALTEDGSVYVSDMDDPAVHRFLPSAGSVPTPDPDPTPVPTAVEAGCDIERDKIAFPRRVQLGETATVRLTLRADCRKPGDFIGADIIVVLDNDHEISRGRLDPRREQYVGHVRQLEQAVAAAFVRGLDVRRHRVGLVSLDAGSLVSRTLTTDVFALIDAIEALSRPGSATQDLSHLLQAAGERLAQDGRPDALPVILLLSDGREIHDHRSVRGEAAMATAELLRASGVLIFSAQMEAGRDTMPENDEAEILLRSIAGADSRFARIRAERDAEPLAHRIYALLQALGAASLEGNLIIHDQMAPDIELVAGSAGPEAIEGPDWLIWRRSLLPATGITLTYTITPTRVGLLPTNAFALAEYDDLDGIRRSIAFPVPEIEVFAPTPTPTPTAAPTPIPVIRELYLPFLAQRHCAPGRMQSDVVLVVDASLSMLEDSRGGRPKIEAAREAVRTFLRLLNFPLDRAALVSFHSQVTTHAGLQPSAEPIRSALEDIRNRSGTRIHLGIEAGAAALRAGADRPRSQKVLILLTDGRSSPEPVVVAEAAATRAKAEGILIFTIGLGPEVETGALERMASDPAYYHHAPDAEDLDAVYRELAREIPCRP